MPFVTLSFFSPRRFRGAISLCLAAFGIANVLRSWASPWHPQSVPRIMGTVLVSVWGSTTAESANVPHCHDATISHHCSSAALHLNFRFYWPTTHVQKVMIVSATAQDPCTGDPFGKINPWTAITIIGIQIAGHIGRKCRRFATRR